MADISQKYDLTTGVFFKEPRPSSTSTRICSSDRPSWKYSSTILLLRFGVAPQQLFKHLVQTLYSSNGLLHPDLLIAWSPLRMTVVFA